MVEGHSEVWLCRDPGSEGCLCSEGAGWLTRALEFYRPEGEKLLSFPNVIKLSHHTPVLSEKEFIMRG